MATGKYIKTLNKINRNIFHFSTTISINSLRRSSSSAAMGGSNQKKPSSSGSSSFSFFSLFRGKPRREYDMKDDFVKAYKVWPSDEDRGRWVAEPGIDRKASAFISSRTERWKSVEVAN